jgi:hypothetical protein
MPAGTQLLTLSAAAPACATASSFCAQIIRGAILKKLLQV